MWVVHCWCTVWVWFSLYEESQYMYIHTCLLLVIIVAALYSGVYTYYMDSCQAFKITLYMYIIHVSML